MPAIKTEGKDTIIFVTKEDHATPSKIHLPEPEQSPGLILPDGEINWNCPCLGGMATGPCGVEFREAFSCFHYSTADPKGANCREPFNTMHTCMSQYPSLYGSKDTDMDDMELNDVGLENVNDEKMSETNSVKDLPIIDHKTDHENPPSNDEHVKRITNSK